jgi:hypothetical protein
MVKIKDYYYKDGIYRDQYCLDGCMFTYSLAMKYLQKLGFNIEESLEYLTLL